MMILPFESKSDETYQEEGTNFFNVKPASYWKDLNIINIKVNSSNNGDVRVVITTPEPYFKGTGAYGGDLIFQTPVKMMKDFYKEDLFSISILFKETEIKYLSKFKSVYLKYPEELVGSEYSFSSKINLSDLLNVIKDFEAAKVAKQKAYEQDRKPVNQLKDFFGIDR
jgi:hypothetical protein